MSDGKPKSQKENAIKKPQTGKPPRLYLRGVFTGFRRGKRTQDENHALVKIEGLNSRKEAHFYLGKRIVYVYKTKNGIKSIWGRICSQHGNSGVVKARFLHNLPPRAIGGLLRVMLYPHRH
ncbi:MAG: eL33 family ribosomal protein [archaeon]|nr:eL33 family ribosomal protein [archaeon]